MERKKIMLAGGLVLVGGLMFMQVSRLNTPAPAPAPRAEAPVQVEVIKEVNVLVATTDIQRGRRLSEDMFEWKLFPETIVSPSYIVDTERPQAFEELAGAVVRADIYSGEPVVDAKLVRAGESGLMAALLSPGMRAVTTRVTTDSAVGGFILPGDRVDILLTIQLPKPRNTSGSNQTRMTQYSASTIFENVKVLAMNDVFSSGPDSPATVGSPSFATFELNQSDAERLMEAAELGNVSLLLRGLSPSAGGRSAATQPRVEEAEASSMVVYRNGRQTQAAIRRP